MKDAVYSSPPKYVILGAGGFAREVADVVRAAGQEVMGFLDDNRAMWGTTLNRITVLGGTEWVKAQGHVEKLKGLCGIGAPRTRSQVVARYAASGLAFGTVIHPRATMTEFVDLGEGTILTAGCVLTNSIRLGRHVHVNMNATIGHDCAIGDYCTIAPSASVSGRVTLGMGVDVGTGAAIIQGVKVGDWAVIGAGAVVISDIPAGATAVGVPARVIKISELPDVQGGGSR